MEGVGDKAAVIRAGFKVVELGKVSASNCSFCRAGELKGPGISIIVVEGPAFEEASSKKQKPH